MLFYFFASKCHLHSWIIIFVFYHCRLVKVDNFFSMANYKRNPLWTSSLRITQMVFGFQVSRIRHLKFPLGMPTFQVFSTYWWHLLLPIFMMMEHSFCFTLTILQWREKWQDSSRTISSRSRMSGLSLIACTWQILWIRQKM